VDIKLVFSYISGIFTGKFGRLDRERSREGLKDNKISLGNELRFGPQLEERNTGMMEKWVLEE